MHGVLKALRKLLFSLMFFIVIIFGGYSAFSWWELKQLRAACSEITKATPVTMLAGIVNRYGFNEHWVSGTGLFDKESNSWLYFLPASSTMGETVCRISHDHTKVLSSTYEPPVDVPIP